MFTKLDEQFETLAADPERRLAAIRKLSKARTGIFWCAVVISILDITELLRGEPIKFVTVFSPMVTWLLVFKFQADVRVLRTIDSLHRNEKTVV